MRSDEERGEKERSHLSGSPNCVELLSFCIKLSFLFVFEEQGLLQALGLKKYCSSIKAQDGVI